MADERHIENRILAISRRLIGLLMRNSERRWGITCQYRSRDQNCSFPKFKMADDRHFENSFIFIAQPWIIRWQMYISIPVMDFNKRSKFCKFKMADGRHIENVFWLHLGALLADRLEIRKGDEESHANTGHVTKTAIFQNSRWRTAAILKFPSRELKCTSAIVTTNPIWRTAAIFKTVFWLYFRDLLFD